MRHKRLLTWWISGIALLTCGLARAQHEASPEALPALPRGGIQVPHRVVASALEAYYVDWNCYPAWRYYTYRGRPVPSFADAALTTPVAYLTRMPTDIFTLDEAYWYAYYSVNYNDTSKRGGWVLISAGPDLDHDVSPEEVYDPYKPNIHVIMKTYEYDMTNGTISNGDLITIRD